MSGVYIKGMQKPNHCRRCQMKNTDDDCVLQYPEMFDGWAEQMANCPLVPVPPHGRLIEDVAVREQIDEWLDSVGIAVVGRSLSYYGELLGCIEDAPTIIPAEEEDSSE